MVRFWPRCVAFLVAFIVSTANAASTKDLNPMTKRKAFIEKLNEFVSLADRGFQTVGSSVKTLYEKFNLMSKLIINQMKSSVRVFEMQEQTQEPVDATPVPDLTTPKVVVTTPKRDVTTLQGVVTTSQPKTTTSQQIVTTSKPEATTPKKVVTTSQPDVKTTKKMVTTSKPAVSTPKMSWCKPTWYRNGTSYFHSCQCIRACSVNTAREDCRRKNARLLTVKTFARQWFITSIIRERRILFGGNDRDEEGTWRWPDGSLMNESFTNWDKEASIIVFGRSECNTVCVTVGQPKATKNKNCMALNRFWARWTAESCTHPFDEYRTGYGCERTRLSA